MNRLIGKLHLEIAVSEEDLARWLSSGFGINGDVQSIVRKVVDMAGEKFKAEVRRSEDDRINKEMVDACMYSHLP